PWVAADVLQALAGLREASAYSRHTARQVLDFHRTLVGALSPAAAAALGSLQGSLAGDRTPAAVISTLVRLRDAEVHPGVPGFQAGIGTALEVLGEAFAAVGPAGGLGAFSPRRPLEVVKACAVGCVSGGLKGSRSDAGAPIGAVVGGAAATAQAVMAALY